MKNSTKTLSSFSSFFTTATATITTTTITNNNNNNNNNKTKNHLIKTIGSPQGVHRESTHRKGEKWK